jgi:CheY-specific phosphatase CheX
MPESLQSVLIAMTQAALETTAFMFAEPGAPEPTDLADDPPSCLATVTFSGAHVGALSIEFPLRLLPVLAANVLGEEESPPDEMQRDALGELANIICGNVLPALDPRGKYSLGAPVVGERATQLCRDATCVASGELQLEGDRVGASLWICSQLLAERTA